MPMIEPGHLAIKKAMSGADFVTCLDDIMFRKAHHGLMSEKITDVDDWVERLDDLADRYKRHRQQCEICRRVYDDCEK